MQQATTVLVTGASGYLGHHLMRALQQHGYRVRALVRPQSAGPDIWDLADEVHLGQITDAEQVNDACKGVDTVISALGITRQRDGASYAEVDLAGNRHVLADALRHGVRRFIYTSVFDAQALAGLPLVDAKLAFSQELRAAPIEAVIVRPNGYYSDLEAVLGMAERGRIWLAGDGSQRLNPIHGADLADFMVQRLWGAAGEYDVGGPEVLSQQQIAAMAFMAVGRTQHIHYLPRCLLDAAAWLLPRLTPQHIHGPTGFFIAASAQDRIAPGWGSCRLEDHFAELAITRALAQPV